MKYELIIIGAGPGGYTAAFKAADLGMKVAVIEKDKTGGACVNRGCIPTKALLYSSHIFNMLENTEEFGINVGDIGIDYTRMLGYKKKSVRAYREELERTFKEKGITYIRGSAKIRRNKTVEVSSDAGREFLEAENIIIATGAAPAGLKIKGSELNGVLNSAKLLSSMHWDYKRVSIIGGGVIGVEFATIFRQLGSEVNIIEKDERLLGPMDPEVSLALADILRNRGINIYCGSGIESISEANPLACNIIYRGERLKIDSDCVLIAVGRQPYTEGLIGEDISLELEENGRIRVNAEFETNIPGIYAIGDVSARTQLAHVAAAQGKYVVERLAGIEHSIRLEVVPSGMYVSLPIVPSCIYTYPEIASVGINEEIARAAGMKTLCGHYMMRSNGKSIIEGENNGFIRLIFEAYSETLVGAQLVCPRATDMISELATAIANSLTAKQLLKAMRAHPTYSEGISYAIEEALAKSRA